MGRLGGPVTDLVASRRGPGRAGTGDDMALSLRPVWKSSDVATALLAATVALAGAAASFIASLPWLRAYQVDGALWLLFLSALAPLAISALFTRLMRFHSLVALTASVAGLVVELSIVNNFDLADTWEGMTRVPAQLLTETLPLTGSPYLMAAPIALTWACAFFCSEATLRTSAPAALSLAAPVAYFTLSFAATTSAPGGPTAAEAAALLGALALMALARQVGEELHTARAAGEAAAAGPPGQAHLARQGYVRRAAGGALACALVAAGLGSGAPHFSPLASRPLSLSRSTKLLGGTIVEPVDTLAALRTTHLWRRPLPVLSVTVNAPWDGYLAMGIMSSYDGGSWGFDPLFRPTGGRIPAPYSMTGPKVDQTYVLLHPLPLPLVPAVERPVQVIGATVDADTATGMLATSGPLEGSYEIVSRSPGVTGMELPADAQSLPARAVPGGGGAAFTELPAETLRFLTPALRYSADLTGRAATPTFSFLEALAVALRAREKWAVPSRARDAPLPAALSGTSLAQVMNAVTVDHAATPEQFATFLAVVGRYLGVPVRLVTGFRAPGADGTAPLRPGAYRIDAADAWTWDEVPVAGYGWVVLDPTPAATTTNVSAPPEQVQPAKPHKPKSTTAVPSQKTSRAVAKAVKVTEPAIHPVDWALVLAGGLPLLLGLALATVALGLPAARRRLRRLARRRSDDPALMAAGAWLELVDGLSRLGLDVPPYATSREVSEQVSEHFGEEFGPPTSLVGAIADQAIYSTRCPVDAARARQAWGSQRDLYRAIRIKQPASTRARSWMAVGHAPSRPFGSDRMKSGTELRSISP